MKRAYSSRAADNHVVDDVVAQSHLMCTAQGCPLRWSVDFGDRLCTMHAGHDPLKWPGITQRLLDIEAERAFRNQEPKASVAHRHFTLAEKKAIGQRLRAAMRNSGGRQWAHRMQQREEAGERLTDAQKAMWRAAIGHVAAADEFFDEEPAHA